MSRLFYETQRTTSDDDEVFGDAQAAASPPPKGERGARSYLEKVSKLIPAELVAGYLTIFGLIPTMASGDNDTGGDINLYYWFIGSYILFQVFTPIYIYLQREANRPWVVHAVLSFLAFAVWAFATTGKELVEWYNAGMASIFLVVFSLISGVVKLNK
ncbi:hypothetical protein [Flagellimonas eckloniae]|uniref:Uncharacterized protein n=1 Tax=Flagellimonas eckloniae TaxID=346185 RepID=A0A0Q0XKB7_9FLAO|nr:hypothetical protein [Allomuricauda eckloniae]KQC31338.1 hypothetical protein AAY42_16685 [Allomuricauda eckloniae]